MSRRSLGLVLGLAAIAALPSCDEGELEASAEDEALGGGDAAIHRAARLVREGRHTFRYDTFGDEAFWGQTLQLHRAIAGAALGGVGDGVSPRTALALGLKVDVDALPRPLVKALRRGAVDLDAPATTLALLRLDAVVGLTGFFDGEELVSIGIQCALCHSTVDSSLAPGIGRRLDGWANRDLDVGQIVAAAPDLSAPAALLGVSEDTLRTVLRGWGPGKFDAAVFLDGKAMRPDGRTAATLIPPAFGLAGVDGHTFTGWGSVTYWNAFVANLEMHGTGTFYDPRLADATRFPIAAAAGFDDVRPPSLEADRITPKLAALQVYQLTLEAPRAPSHLYRGDAARRGRALFVGKADCARCHVPPLYTEPGWNRHTAEEIGIDDFQARRSPDARYRTTPLRGLWTHPRGGYYHDGRFATLEEVVAHYDAQGLGLTASEEADLVEFLRSL
jgi:hypothetical protein